MLWALELYPPNPILHSTHIKHKTHLGFTVQVQCTVQYNGYGTARPIWVKPVFALALMYVRTDTTQQLGTVLILTQSYIIYSNRDTNMGYEGKAAGREDSARRSLRP